MLKRRVRAQSLLPTVAAAVLTVAFLAATSGAATAAAEPARWRPYDLIIDLRDLPKSYSCDALYYKLWDVLWALGARPGMKILTYDCERTTANAHAGVAPGVPARSPRVHLLFALPDALSGGEARWADVRAVERTIRLEPGHPRTLDASDCALVQQIKDTLLPALAADVVGSRLDCGAPASSARFSLSIRTLTPEARGAARTGAAHGAAPAGA
jgi:hypothetical protein